MKKFVLLTLILLAVTIVALGSSLERESYFENGQLSEKMSYKFGEKDGLHAMYYPDGALFLQANYQAGKRHGIKTLFSPDGRIIETEDWVLGKLSRTSKKPKKKKSLVKFEPFVCGFGEMSQLILSKKSGI
jgi:antitoxin component YwqK of YwqJK toxin-antitoxin module